MSCIPQYHLIQLLTMLVPFCVHARPSTDPLHLRNPSSHFYSSQHLHTAPTPSRPSASRQDTTHPQIPGRSPSATSASSSTRSSASHGGCSPSSGWARPSSACLTPWLALVRGDGIGGGLPRRTRSMVYETACPGTYGFACTYVGYPATD